MPTKVKVAVFDKDQNVRNFQKCEISKDGSKLKIKKGGKKHWYPTFDNTSYLEFPKKFLGIIPSGNEKVYIVRNHASACVNFKTEKVPDINLEEVEKAARNDILKGIGTEEKQTPIAIYATLALILFDILLSLGVVR